MGPERQSLVQEAPKESGKVPEIDLNEEIVNTDVNNVSFVDNLIETGRNDSDLEIDHNGPMLEFPTKPKSMRNAKKNSLANPDKGIYIQAHYKCLDSTLPLKVLVDCGASSSLLNNKVFDQIPKHLGPWLDLTQK